MQCNNHAHQLCRAVPLSALHAKGIVIMHEQQTMQGESMPASLTTTIEKLSRGHLRRSAHLHPKRFTWQNTQGICWQPPHLADMLSELLEKSPHNSSSSYVTSVLYVYDTVKHQCEAA